jgi:beta-glucosidase/6-phospho-beta-glucosidase/beta-galactosidase
MCEPHYQGPEQIVNKTFGLIAVDRATQIRYPKNSLKVLGDLAAQL